MQLRTRVQGLFGVETIPGMVAAEMESLNG